MHIDFGDLTAASIERWVDHQVLQEGIFGGGTPDPSANNIIDYITIATTGNAQDFGDLTLANQMHPAGLSNK